jgi:2'-5' RNA ligase
VIAFPPELPASLDDSSSIRAHDWQAFASLGQMEDHWARPDWRPGTRAYYWMLVFDGHDLIKLAKQCQARIASPAFDPVPLDALHVTVGRIGFTDQVTLEVVHQVAAVAERQCAELKPFAVEVGPLAGSRGALRFSVAPWSPLLTMHQKLAAATSQVNGRQAVMDTRYFWPHLSIAYANTGIPLASLRGMVQELRKLPPIEVPVPGVSLVELWRDGQSYRFGEVAFIGFGA